MKYRPEVDGLRALAVIPVILFHAGFTWFSGGHVGVDVFFVISGYLITSIILTEKEAATFSIAGFYERRARRILPALFVVMFACAPIAWFWMTPAQLRSFSQSLIAVSVFGSNVLFWLTSGYFDSAAEEKPLLHTWSLGVEEQYYVLFPLFVILFWRFGLKRLAWVTAGVAVVSFGLSQWGGRADDAIGHFYLAPTRAWELLIGCVLAMASIKTPFYERVSPTANNLLSACGLLLVVGAVFLYDRSTPSPGVHTLAPTVGTALILAFAHPSTLVARLLSLKWIVGVGLISYSAYLWHQPLFAFARIHSLYRPSAAVFACLSAATLGLAYLTWRYVEQPFRDRRRFSRRQVFTASVVGSLLFIGGGAIGYAKRGFEGPVIAGRFDAGPPLRVLVDPAGRNCANQQPADACEFPSRDGEVPWVILGDSHAVLLAGPLWSVLQRTGSGFVDLSMKGCYYAPGLSVLVDGSPTDYCDEDFQSRRRARLLSMAPSVIVVFGRLPLYLSPVNFDNQEGGIEKRGPFVLSEYPLRLDPQRRVDFIANAIAGSVRELIEHGHTVILVYPVPEIGWHTPQRVQLLSHADLATEDIIRKVSVRYDVSHRRVQRSYDILDSVGSSPRLLRVYPEDLFCNVREQGRCETIMNNTIVYSDIDHLSPFGMSLLADRIVSAFDAHKGERAR